LSPEGKITRYLNGTYFLPFEFKLAMLEASKGQAGPTINKILQYCYSYDPVGQAYVLNITKITGTIILAMGIIVFLLLVIRKPRKKTR
jgi:protein SCO1/2